MKKITPVLEGEKNSRSNPRVKFSLKLEGDVVHLMADNLDNSDMYMSYYVLSIGSDGRLELADYISDKTGLDLTPNGRIRLKN